MNGLTISMPEIIARLARKVSCDDRIAGDFLKEFSTVVTQGLMADGFVKIAGLGTFKVTNDVEGKPTVEFAPDKSLADKVNAPFAIFETVEVADNISDEELKGDISEEVAASVTVNIKVAETLPDEDETADKIVDNIELAGKEEDSDREEAVDKSVETALPTPPPIPLRFTAPRSGDKPQTEDKPQPEVSQPRPELSQPQSVVPQMAAPQSANDSPMSVILEPESRVTVMRMDGHTTLTLVMTAIAAMLIGVVGCFIALRWHDAKVATDDNAGDRVEIAEEVDPEEVFVVDSTEINVNDTDSIVAEQIEDEDAVATADTHEMTAGAAMAANKEVTDTVRPGNYLSVMARRHYGNSKFWVYIYLENQDKIKDPDNLEDGMVLVIPPKSKYDIDPQDRESLRKADKEAYKVMTR